MDFNTSLNKSTETETIQPFYVTIAVLDTLLQAIYPKETCKTRTNAVRIQFILFKCKGTEIKFKT